MRFHDETWRDRLGRMCVGGTAGGVIVWFWTVTAELALNGPVLHPRYLIADYACGYGMTVGLAVGAAAGLSVRPAFVFRPPTVVLAACCFVVWFAATTLTPAYSRLGPPPLCEFTGQVLGRVALALGLAGSLWCLVQAVRSMLADTTTGP